MKGDLSCVPEYFEEVDDAVRAAVRSTYRDWKPALNRFVIELEGRLPKEIYS